MRVQFFKTFLFVLLSINSVSRADDAKPKATPLEQDPSESKDISNLEKDYWRPNQDDLDVIQNRAHEKAARFEFGLHYGIYQGQDFVDAKSSGISATYNITNLWFVEVSHMNITTEDNDFLQSVKSRFGFTPDFNRERRQTIAAIGFTPLYAKFSLIGKKISHFETYIAPGLGVTQTSENRFSQHLTIGEKFYLTENLIFRIDWRMTRYTDQITTTQGSTSKSNGGSGFVEETKKNHNIIFGLGWMF